MKQINNFILEKLRINKDTISGVLNEVDVKLLKNFTEKDIEKVINWINNDMPDDIRPIVITNTRKNISWDEPGSQIFLFYTENYNESKPFNIPYIRFFYDDEGLLVDIYDDQDVKYYCSEKFGSIKDLDKCFDYIESKHDIIKNLI